MSSSSKQTSDGAHLEFKAGLVFDYLDNNKDGKLELQDILEFPRKLEKSGKTELAVKLKELYLTFWSILNEKVGRKDRQSLTKEEYIKAIMIIWKTDWYRNTFILGVADAYFQSIDTDQDGFISLEEWRQYQNKRGLTDEAVIISTFAKMDKNGDGKISPDEVRHAYTVFGLSDDLTEDYSFIYDCNAK